MSPRTLQGECSMTQVLCGSRYVTWLFHDSGTGLIEVSDGIGIGDKEIEMFIVPVTTETFTPNLHTTGLSTNQWSPGVRFRLVGSAHATLATHRRLLRHQDSP